MRADNKHIIQKQTIGINFDSMDDSVGLQNRVAEVFYEQLQPRMQVLLDELFGENQFASIDKLEIDCGQLNLKNWEQEFTTQAVRKLKEGLLQVNKKVIDVKAIEEINVSETFFFFLENGFLPWNKRIDSTTELEKLLKVDEKLIAQLQKLIQQKANVAKRLAYRFSAEFVAKLITAFTNYRQQETELLSVILEKVYALQSGKVSSDRIEKQLVDEAILTVFASDENKNREFQFFSFLLTKVENNAELKSEIREIIKKLHVLSEKQRPATKENLPESELLKSQEKISEKHNEPAAQVNQQPETRNQKHIPESAKPADTIYIANAGLVLLHPFLPALFNLLKLTNNNNWIDDGSRHKAVSTLEFLATGKDEIEEFNLMLNKILCGIDIDEIVPAEIKLEVELKTECEDLLQNVITHWSVLKNTSTDGLREAFLQRNGRLSRFDDGWHLKVEQKSIDVLLDQLPWGIGIIILPWMNERLYVEWS